MLTKRLVLIIALLALVLSPVVLAPGAAAQQSKAPFAAEICRLLDEEGLLDIPGNEITRGECVALINNSPNEGAGAQVAASCGRELNQEFTETTNKGQCIQAVRALLEP